MRALEELEKNLENIRRAVKYSGNQRQEEAFASGLKQLQAYYNVRPHKSNGKCSFWKIEMALLENPEDSLRIPLLQAPNLFYPWCCERTGCLEDSNQAVILCNDKFEIIQANYQACQVTGIALSQLLNKDVRELWKLSEDVDYQKPDITFDAELTRPDGKPVALTVTRTRLVQAGEVLNLITLDVADGTINVLGEADESMQQDPLTGLPNRYFFIEQLRMAITTANKQSTHLGIYMVDINDLQSINKEFGYRTGDSILCTVGERLIDRMRTSDVISRLGGDEFIVLIPEFKMSGAEAVAHKILSVFEQPFAVDGASVRITANIGICFYPGCGDTAESLLSNANLALEQSKERGRGVYHISNNIFDKLGENLN